MQRGRLAQEHKEKDSEIQLGRSAHGPEMTGYSITPESSIRDNWMDFILIYALSFSIAHRLNLCMGFHPLPSPAIMHFTLIIMVGILSSRAAFV